MAAIDIFIASPAYAAVPRAGQTLRGGVGAFVVLVKVEQIPETGSVRVDEALPPSFVDDFLPMLQDLHASGPGSVTLQLSKQGENILVHGTAGCTIAGECAACLKPMTLTLAPKIGLILFKRTVTAMKDSEAEAVAAEEEGTLVDDPTPDEGAGEYDGKVVDWGSIVREQLLLALPMAPRCKDDCAGLCATCGVDKNLEACDCNDQRIDPRWEKLKLVKL